MLITDVKASAITNLTDARYFAAWNVKWLGFSLDETDADYVSPDLVAAIREWVDGVQIVGEFRMSEADRINQLAEELQLDAVQLGPFADASLRMALSDHYLIQELVVARDTPLAALEGALEDMTGQAALFALQFDYSGLSTSDLAAGKPFAIADLAALCERFPILLSMVWEPMGVRDLVSTLQPAGIVLRGGEEEKVGYKSFDELDDIFENLEDTE